MSGASELLWPYCSELFVGRDAAGGQAALSCPMLEDLYHGFNGGYFWRRALLVRPMVGVSESVLAVAAWNAPGLWKHLFGVACADVVFFAEDVFGGQFGVRSGCVVQFDPETAEIAHCASSLEEWVRCVNDDSAYFTGWPVLEAWEKGHSQIQAGCRLLPRQPFVLGGEFDSANMVLKSDVEGMRIRAQLWESLKDLPDGQKVVFRVAE